MLKSLLQVSSLRHLILLGFFVSFIPMSLLVWKSNVIQKTVSLSSIEFTKGSITTVRLAVEMDSLLVDIERGIRQYLILKSEPLLTLAQANIEKYLALINDICSNHQLESVNFCTEQRHDVSALAANFQTRLASTLDTQFTMLKNRQTQMMDQLWQYLEQSSEQQQRYVDQQQQIVTIWLIIIALATFFLVVIMSGRMVAPVKNLEEKIKAIGSGEQSDADESIPLVWPREFRNIFEKLIWLSARLKQLEVLRQSFLRHASHEFKTPLSSIQEGCSILNEELAGPLSAQQKEVLALLEQSTHRLRHLTEQLLDYNYFLQQQEPHLTKLDPSVLLNELGSQYELAFKNRQQQLTIDCTSISICTDHKLFTRIIENLLSNAQAYGEQGGKVLIQLSQRDKALVLTVANTGPKISDMHLEHLLEPFYRAEVPRFDSLRGSGLGLSIVNDCARLLGGQVELGSDNHFDFMATVILPYAKD